MILSFHPCFESDINILCAGRLPDESDLDAIQAADAIVLPQGCKKELFEMAVRHCRHVFPDYHARFQYPGKIGQIRLFESLNIPHPRTTTFHDIHQYHQSIKSMTASQELSYPLVCKYNWGGEGETVFLIKSQVDLQERIKAVEQLEKNNQKGFMIQEYIPSGHKVIRVVVIGTCYQSYWRIQDDPDKFTTSLSTGARIDHEKDPDLQKKAIQAVQHFCQKTSINLAGFDLLFSIKENPEVPLFLEINYFFGRKGLGGSEQFYKLLDNEIKAWIDALPKH
jgi:ribosomal protein S6--L-glutamate ligase